MSQVPTPLEQAAREICHARGIVPDSNCMNEWGFFYPAWCDVRDEIVKAIQVQDAIARNGLTLLDIPKERT
jgi:hypothetical protein